MVGIIDYCIQKDSIDAAALTLKGPAEQIAREISQTLGRGAEVDIDALEKSIGGVFQSNLGHHEKIEIIEQAGFIVQCDASKIESDVFRNYVLSSLNILLSQLKRRVTDAHQLLKDQNREDFYSGRPPVSTNDAVNKVEVDYWHRFKHFNFDTGLFSTGADHITMYGRFMDTPLNVSGEHLDVRGDVAAGLFVSMPQSSDVGFNDVVSGMIPSANLMLGGHWSLAENLSASAGIESSTKLYLTIHAGLDLIIDNNAGAGLVYSPSRDYQIGAQAVAHTNIGPRNIGDIHSIFPRYEGTEFALTFANPLLDVNAGVYATATGLEASLGLGMDFSAGAGVLSTAVHAVTTLEGRIAANPMAVFLSFGYAMKLDEEQGLRASSTFSAKGENLPGPELQTLGTDLDGEGNFYLKEWLLRRSGTQIDCYTPVGEGNGQQECNFFYEDPEKGTVGHIFECRSVGPDLVCHDKDDSYDSVFPIHEEARIRLSGERQYEILSYDVNLPHPLFQAIYDSEDLEGFATFLKGTGFLEKVSYLQYLARKLYEQYDAAGLGIISGSGDIDDVNKNELYGSIRNGILKHERNPKTVCRGIAPFLTYVADMWGLEAYSARLQTNGSNHVVALVKSKGGPWHVIDQGKKSFVSIDQSISKTLDDFSVASGYPPQPFYELYDSRGDYLRSIETNFGNTLFDKTTPARKLKGYLMGSDLK